MSESRAEQFRRSSARHRQFKTSSGLCYYGGCWEPLHTMTMCERHAAAAAERERSRRRAKGVPQWHEVYRPRGPDGKFREKQ